MGYKPETITVDSISSGLVESKRFTINGVDKKGHPLFIITIKNHRPGDYSRDELMRYGILQIERAIKLSERYVFGCDNSEIVWGRVNS